MLSTLVICTAWKTVKYNFDPRIHNFGNVGFGGRMHAMLAPIAERVIDVVAYDGEDVRTALHGRLDAGTVVDLGCGTGSSTPPGACGVDSSNAMISVARSRFKDKRFVVADAETFGEEDAYDTALVSYVLHEAPETGRRAILANAMRIARRSVYVMDISSSYIPSPLMLTGEPYVLDYLEKIDSEIAEIALSPKASGLITEGLGRQRVTLYHIVLHPHHTTRRPLPRRSGFEQTWG